MATTRDEMQRNFLDPSTHGLWSLERTWAGLELERAKAMWINDAITKPGEMQTSHIKALELQIYDYHEEARNIKYAADEQIAEFEVKTRASREELTLRGVAGWGSSMLKGGIFQE